MPNVDFQVAYDGDGVKDGVMDIRDLAPALLALGDFFQESNRLFNGNHAQISVNVSAKFEQASFDINLKVIQGILEQAKTLLLGREITVAKDILDRLACVGKPIVSLIGLLKWLKGRRPDSQTVLNSGMIRIQIDGDIRDVDDLTFRLSKNGAVRRALEQTVKPLERDGIDAFKVQRKGKIIETVRKDEARYLAAPRDDGEQLLDNVTETVLEVVKPSFDGDLKWKFSNGMNRFDASIEDQHFNHEIEAGQHAFSKGDTLRVQLRTETWRTEEGHLKSRLTVVRVLTHVPRPIAEQEPLVGFD